MYMSPPQISKNLSLLPSNTMRCRLYEGRFSVITTENVSNVEGKYSSVMPSTTGSGAVLCVEVLVRV